MKFFILAGFITTALTVSVFSQTKKIESIYTGLDKSCKTLELNTSEAGFYRGICPGVGGYKLELIEGDIRQTINIIPPKKKKKYELDLWTVVSSAFSYVGQKAEWRVIRNGKTITPAALIIRFNASKSPDTPELNNSYLVIAKITSNSACVTDVVEPTVKSQNVVARQLADASAGKPCKTIN